MKKIACLVLMIFHLSAQDDNYLEIVKQIKEDKKDLPAPDYTLSFDDTEWTPEKLNAFTEEVERRARKKEWTQEEKAFIANIESAPKKIEFEGSEAEFQPEILSNPLAAMGVIASEEEVPMSEETIFKTCEESGTFTREFRQTLEVTLLPELKQVKQCNGHTLSEEIKGKDGKKGKDDKERAKKVKARVVELKQQYENDSTVHKGFTVKDEAHKYHTEIISHFQHIDDASACNHFQTIEIPGTTVEKDEWKTDAPEAYARIQSSPYCKLILVDDEEGETQERTIHGKKVSRTAWARTLFFQCAPEDGKSPCKVLEAQGGQLVKKRCILRSEETGDCEFWEKTYDLGKRMAAHKKYKFKDGQEVWGLNWADIDPESMKWDKKSDLPKVRAMLKLVADMPLGEGANIFNLDEKMAIFNGTVHKCNCHLIDELWDCCYDIKALWPAHCDKQEIELDEMRDEGRCHKVGSYHNKTLGIKTSKTSVYCCYPTKLLKIFNEQARERMKLGWGKPKKPNCAGFSLEQMDGQVHLDTMDLSCVDDDLQIDEGALKKEMEEKLRAALEDPTLKNFFLKGPNAIP